MLKPERQKEKVALGLFLEGPYLHMVALSKKDKRVRLKEARIVKLDRAKVPAEVGETVLTDLLDGYGDETAPIDLTDEIENSNFSLEDMPATERVDNEILREILQAHGHPKNQLAVSLAEPQIFYANHESNWGLKGAKLRKKVIAELASEKQSSGDIRADAINLMPTADGRLISIVRDREIPLLDQILKLRGERKIKLPHLTTVDAAEFSLINLVNANYQFSVEEISVIVYMGHEYSRLIFMQGHEVFNISYVIGAGLDSENITHTIFSRIFLEQDNLNLPKLHHIILTGEAFEVQLKDYLQERLSNSVDIDYLRLENLDVAGHETFLSTYSVALGAAWRVLENQQKPKYRTNLIPDAIRDGQKRFKLGLVGWILLAMLPMIVLFTMAKIENYKQEILDLSRQRQLFTEELNHLQDIEIRVNAKKAQLMNFEKAFSVVDAMAVGENAWSAFLSRLSGAAADIGQLWITDALPKTESTVTLKGYALYRAQIPRLAKSIGRGALQRVEVQEIRGRTVYYFEMIADIPAGDGEAGK